jgi:hypothetical protein
MSKYFINLSGDYWETLSDPSDEIIAAYPVGTVEVTQRPSHLHTYEGGAWVAPSDAVYDEWKATEVRAERDRLLSTKVDPLVSNTLRWADLSSDKQNEWTVYRQALLDVPQQSGFPSTVTWPTKPE